MSLSQRLTECPGGDAIGKICGTELGVVWGAAQPDVEDARSLPTMTDVLSPERLRAAYITARDALLAGRVPAGHWVGELSTSALSTATAVMALHLANPFEPRERIDARSEEHTSELQS